MTKALENDIPPDPRQIGLGSPGTVVKSFQRIAQTLHEFRWTPHGFFKTGCGEDGIAHRSGSRATDLPSWNLYIESRTTGGRGSRCAKVRERETFKSRMSRQRHNFEQPMRRDFAIIFSPPAVFERLIR